MNRPISTAPFTIAPSVYAQRDIASMAERHWWVLALPIAIFGIMAIADWRWSIVALAVIFVIAPMAAMFTWISLLGKPTAIRDLKPHTLAIEPHGRIKISWADNAHVTITVPPAAIEAISANRRHIFIRFIMHHHSAKVGQASCDTNEIAVPIKAFASQNDATATYVAISTQIATNSRLV